MKKYLLITIFTCISFSMKAQWVVSDPGNFAFNVTKWIEEKAQLIQNSETLIAISKTLKESKELYQKVDDVYRQSKYIQECLQMQMESGESIVKFIKKNPAKIADARLYESIAEEIKSTSAQINQLGKMINLVLNPLTKMTMGDRVRESRSIHKEMKEKKQELNAIIDYYETRNKYDSFIERLAREK